MKGSTHGSWKEKRKEVKDQWKGASGRNIYAEEEDVKTWEETHDHVERGKGKELGELGRKRWQRRSRFCEEASC